MRPATVIQPALCPLGPQYAGSHSLTSVFYAAFLKLLTLIFLVPVSSSAISQNLFANPGFEDINTCTEYNAPCEKEAWFFIKPVTIPVFTKTAPPQLLGSESMSIPIQNIFDQRSMHQLVYTMLLCKLEKGKKFRLSFFINTLRRPFYKIDIGFSKKEPATFGFDSTDIEHTVHLSKEILGDTRLQGWQAVEYDYTASGDERFFIIGNISGELLLFEPKHRMNSQGMVYYFIDEIKLRPLDSSPLYSNADKIAKKLYAQNYRHTDRSVLDTLDDVKIFSDTVTVPGVFFETGKSALKPVFKKLLDSLGHSLRGKQLISVNIEGHTDNAGTEVHNILLSRERAESVLKYLLILLPAEAQKMKAAGNGEALPVADNKTKAGMAKNRRAEIILSYTLK